MRSQAKARNRTSARVPRIRCLHETFHFVTSESPAGLRLAVLLPARGCDAEGQVQADAPCGERDAKDHLQHLERGPAKLNGYVKRGLAGRLEGSSPIVYVATDLARLVQG